MRTIFRMFLLMILVTCSSCSLFEGDELVFEQEYYDDSQIDPNEIGTTGNIAVNYDDWVYYRSNDDKLYRSRNGGTEGVKLTNDSIRDICVTSNWVYYTSYSDKGSIFKMRPNGTERTKINDEFSHFVNVKDDWIYYSSSKDGCIYKIRTDGTDKTKLANEKVDYFTIDSEWIYYKPSDDYRYYKMRLDGIESAVLSDDTIYSMKIVDDWIYYIGDCRHIYKMHIDGTDIQKLNR